MTMKEIILEILNEIEKKDSVVSIAGGRGYSAGKAYPSKSVGVLQLLGHEEGEKQENLVKDYFDNSRGRSVRRRYFAFALPKQAKAFTLPGIKTIVATETISSKNTDNKVTAEWRYYVSSHNKSNPKLHSYIRNHWSIENE